MRRLMALALLCVVFGASQAAAQDLVGVSYDDGQTWYLNTGEVAAIDWTWIHCTNSASFATVMIWAGYDVTGTTGKVLFAGCAAAVIYQAISAWVNSWTMSMMDISARYFGNSLHWGFWIQVGGY